MTSDLDREALEKLRRRIDALDDQILDLIQRRAALAEEIGRIKKRGRAAVVDGVREREILDRLAARAGGQPLDGGTVRKMYQAIIAACRAVQIEKK